MLQDKLLKWVITYLLEKLDKDVAAGALCALLRAALAAAKGVAAKTETTLDDEVLGKVGKVVDELCAALGH